MVQKFGLIHLVCATNSPKKTTYLCAWESREMLNFQCQLWVNFHRLKYFLLPKIMKIYIAITSFTIWSKSSYLDILNSVADICFSDHAKYLIWYKISYLICKYWKNVSENKYIFKTNQNLALCKMCHNMGFLWP